MSLGRGSLIVPVSAWTEKKARGSFLGQAFWAEWIMQQVGHLFGTQLTSGGAQHSIWVLEPH